MGGVTVPFGQPPQYPGNQNSGNQQQPQQGAPQQQQPQQPQQQPTVPPAFVSTPNAERHLLEADALRRRQLGSAFLHGSGRTWRDRRAVWPFAAMGIVIVAVAIAGIAVTGAFKQQQCDTAKQAQMQASPSATATPAQCVSSKKPSATPTAKPSGPPAPSAKASQVKPSPTAPASASAPAASKTPGSIPGQPGS
jgi:hypothetical protein